MFNKALIIFLFTSLSYAIAAPLEFSNERGLLFTRAQYQGVEYHIFSAAPAQLRLLWQDSEGKNYVYLRSAAKALQTAGETPLMLMNAGIYTQDYQPAGLWIENGKQLRELNQREGAGNFHIQPNGVLWFDDQSVGIMTTHAWAAQALPAQFAVQSGPMMIIDGKINSRFIKNLSSPHKRNAACINQEGALYLIISAHIARDSEWPSFYRMSEALLSFGCQQALYLDGTISHYYAIGQSDWFHWRPFVGMIAIVESK